MAICPKCSGSGGDYMPDGEGNVHRDSCDCCNGQGQIPDNIPEFSLQELLEKNNQERIRFINEMTIAQWDLIHGGTK